MINAWETMPKSPPEWRSQTGLMHFILFAFQALFTQKLLLRFFFWSMKLIVENTDVSEKFFFLLPVFSK